MFLFQDCFFLSLTNILKYFSSRFRFLTFNFAQGSWSLYNWSQSFLFPFHPGAFFSNCRWLEHLSARQDGPCKTTVTQTSNLLLWKCLKPQITDKVIYYTLNYARDLIIHSLSIAFIQIIFIPSQQSEKCILGCRFVCQVLRVKMVSTEEYNY